MKHIVIRVCITLAAIFVIQVTLSAVESFSCDTYPSEFKEIHHYYVNCGEGKQGCDCEVDQQTSGDTDHLVWDTGISDWVVVSNTQESNAANYAICCGT